MLYGSFGKLLRINLEEKKFYIEELSASLLNAVIGGKGLGTALLLQEVDPQVDPFSPGNKVILTTGPACDTDIPAASRYGVFSKSPLTGIYAESYSGGHIAPLMKRTGFDAVILEKSAEKPVFLDIDEEGVTFYDADELWGMETYQAEKLIKERANKKKAQALVIGPAGEKLVKFACIKNNNWRSAGRTGLGAVMGSKKVKGIVFSGRSRAPLADPKLLTAYIQRLKEKARSDSAVKVYYEFGTPVMVALLNNVNSFPTRYWHRGTFENWPDISAEGMKKNLHVKSRACYKCFMACGKMSEVIKGRHKGLKIEGPEYETIYSFGGLCCIKEIEEIIYLNDLCDRLGIDTISTGNLIALAIEAGTQGKLSSAPQYGNVEQIAQLVKDIGERQNLGDLLAEGIRTASREFGMEDEAIHVKGLEPAGYDPRILKGMGLSYAVSDRGACHLRTTFYKAELSGLIPPDKIEGKAELLIDFEDRMALFDSLIFCRFFRDLVPWEDIATVIKATTGIELEKKELASLANNIISQARIFNIKAGITSKDDTLPSRFFNEPLDAEGKQVIKREELNFMLKEYYRLRNWGEDGIPLQK